MGIMAGIVGFSPLLIADALAQRARRRTPSVGWGLAAVAVSFAFLLVAVGVAWRCAGKSFLTFTAGVVVGYFAMLALLIALALRRS